MCVRMCLFFYVLCLCFLILLSAKLPEAENGHIPLGESHFGSKLLFALIP